MKVLHVIPVSSRAEELRFHGSTKDIRGRTEIFKSLGLSVKEIAVSRQDKVLIEILKKKWVSKFGIVLIDGPGSFPKAVRYIKKNSPKSVVIYRSHNPEFFHRIDWMLAEPTIIGKYQRLKRAVNGLWRDIKTIRHADYIFPISDWDAEHYWRHLGSSRKVVTVPYFLPTAYLDENTGNQTKDKLCVSFSAIQATPLMADAIRNFVAIIDGLGADRGDWVFSVVGNACDVDIDHAKIKAMGVIESPFDVLNRARAVAILSDYGRGFKTKILEAIRARAYVIVTPVLYKRLPREVLPYCIPVRKTSVDDFRTALDKCMEPFPPGDPNSELKSRALTAMSSVFKDVS